MLSTSLQTIEEAINASSEVRVVRASVPFDYQIWWTRIPSRNRKLHFIGISHYRITFYDIPDECTIRIPKQHVLDNIEIIEEMLEATSSL